MSASEPAAADGAAWSGEAVVQVVQSLGPGGLEAMAVNLALALSALGIRCVVVSLERGGVLEAKLKAAGVEYHVIGGGRYRDPRVHRSLAAIFRRHRPRAVHTHHFASLASSVAVAKLARVPRVVHTEHAFLYLDERPGLRRPLRWLSRATDSFVVVGAAMKSYYVERVGIAADRLQVIVNGVDTTRYRPAADRAARRRRAGLPDGTLIGTAGRFAAVKNYPMLLEAVAAVRRSRPDVRLVMAGDGEDRAELEALAQRLGFADAIHFLGWRTDVADVVACLDAFALTSWSEGLPLVVLEAMACGVPVVTTAVGDLPRVIDSGSTGFLVPSGDVSSLTEVLARLADDASLRDTAGRAGLAYVAEHYSQDVMVRRYLAEYGLCRA